MLDAQENADCPRTKTTLVSAECCRPRTDWGWGPVRPACLQALHNPKWFTAFLCVFILTQGMMINGITSLVITTIEKRFDLTSFKAGTITSTNEISVAIMGVYVSYFGAHGHKPRWLGTAALLIASGGFLFSVPHYISGRYRGRGVGSSLGASRCLNSTNFELNSSSCSVEQASNMLQFIIFIVAQILIGAGAAPVFTLGTAFIEESVSKSASPMYIGAMYTTAALAPAVGFFVGGAFLNMYVDIDAQTDLTPEDPNWVGAWWMGFLVCSVLAVVTAVPLCAFSKRFPGMEVKPSEKLFSASELGSETNCIKHRMRSKSWTKGVWKFLIKITQSLKRMASAIRSVLSNLTFVFDTIAMALEKLLIFGLGVFFPKLIESQFGITAARSSIYTGLAVVPGIAGGTLVGGLLSAKLNSDPSRNAKFSFIVTLVAMAMSGTLIIGCPDVKIAGLTDIYPTQSLQRVPLAVNLTSPCNKECSCSRIQYSPVCGGDNTTFYSACYAGCAATTSKTGIFANCSCVVNTNGSLGSATKGKCDVKCDKLVVYLLCLFVVLFLTFLPEIPATTVILRCVQEEHKSLALGLQWLIIGLLGRIPGPVLFGSLIDDACLLWQEDCGQRGSCAGYSNRHLSQLTVISALVIKALSASCFFLCWYFYRPLDTRTKPVVAKISIIEKTLTTL